MYFNIFELSLTKKKKRKRIKIIVEVRSSLMEMKTTDISLAEVCTVCDIVEFFLQFTIVFNIFLIIIMI